MAKRVRVVDHRQVRWFSLRELAEMWAPELGMPEAALLRELQFGVLNLPQWSETGELPDQPPPDGELPDPDFRVDRDWLAQFCRKQRWVMPRFWSDEPDVEADRLPGRPTLRPAILEELRRRHAAGELPDTLADTARELQQWAVGTHPGNNAVPQGSKVVANMIRREYHRLKNEH